MIGRSWELFHLKWAKFYTYWPAAPLTPKFSLAFDTAVVIGDEEFLHSIQTGNMSETQIPDSIQWTSEIGISKHICTLFSLEWFFHHYYPTESCFECEQKL